MIIMKKLFSFSILSAFLFFAISACGQQDKSKRPSPPAKVSEKVGATTVSIDYSQPALKGSTIGKDVEPMDGQVWRAGANEATVFEADKAVKVNGKDLPAGKYGLYMISGSGDWTVIFSKNWNTWGTNYAEKDDALRVPAKVTTASSSTDKLTYTIDKSGKVQLHWGNKLVEFAVQ
jgi:hypothetical protein